MSLILENYYVTWPLTSANGKQSCHRTKPLRCDNLVRGGAKGGAGGQFPQLVILIFLNFVFFGLISDWLMVAPIDVRYRLELINTNT